MVPYIAATIMLLLFCILPPKNCNLGCRSVKWLHVSQFHNKSVWSKGIIITTLRPFVQVQGEGGNAWDARNALEQVRLARLAEERRRKRAQEAVDAAASELEAHANMLADYHYKRSLLFRYECQLVKCLRPSSCAASSLHEN